MKKMKASSALLGVVTMTSLLAGCGTSASPANGTGNTTGNTTHQPVSITIASWNDAADSLKAEIPGFEKKYPWIHVTIQYRSGSYQKLIPQLTAGAAPDVIQTQQRDFPTFLRMFPGDFVNLNTQLSTIKSDIAPVALSLAQQNGNIYGAPWDLGPVAMYYRKDMFQKAGIDPNSIKTWADYLAAGKKLVAAYNGKVKMVFANETTTNNGIPGKMNMLLSELGGNFTTQSGKINFTSPQMIQAMDTVQSWAKAGIVTNAPTWNDEIAAVTNNQVATILYPVWYAGTLMNSAASQKGNWGIIPMPSFTAGGPNQADFGGSMLAITKTSPHPNADWDFINYSLYTNTGEDVMLKYGLYPSWSPYYQTANFKSNFPYFGEPIYPFFASVSSKIPEMRYGSYFWDFEQPLFQAYVAILHGADPKTSLQQAEQKAAKLSHQAISGS